MLPLIIPTGQRFGRLTVIAEETVKGRPRRFLCQCDCGNQYSASLRDLRWGTTVSCGCRRKEILRTHGGTGTPEHMAWRGMTARCCNPNNSQWKNYGGRGITVCERWRASFAAFLEDMGPRPSARHSLDRYPDNNGNYEPGNCRWATGKQQERNKRGNVWVNYGGVKRLLVEVAEETGKNINTVRLRRFRGWPDSELFR